MHMPDFGGHVNDRGILPERHGEPRTGLAGGQGLYRNSVSTLCDSSSTKQCFHQGTIVKILSRYLKRLISGDDVMGANAASLRNIIVWIFIALVAAFLTHPSDDPRNMTPVPWPAELGLDNPGI
jgi:hypothetical protein